MRISCSDTGPGVDSQLQHTLFEKYGRLDRDQSIEGTGLGLFVTKNIVDAHGGRIEVKSTAGKGTTFILSFPHKVLVALAVIGLIALLPDNMAHSENTMIKKWNSNQAVSKEELSNKLSPLQYEVTQEEGTERPFSNEYWDNKRAGIYVDVVSGEPLFSSDTKYDSGTGWPSFYKPLVDENVSEHKDSKLFSKRVEVRSKLADSHLGHVFDDGPAPTGKRFCMNSAAMRFIPLEEMEKEGYGAYVKDVHKK